jgi:hypothetical protein
LVYLWVRLAFLRSGAGLRHSERVRIANDENDRRQWPCVNVGHHGGVLNPHRADHYYSDRSGHPAHYVRQFFLDMNEAGLRLTKSRQRSDTAD